MLFRSNDEQPGASSGGGGLRRQHGGAQRVEQDRYFKQAAEIVDGLHRFLSFRRLARVGGGLRVMRRSRITRVRTMNMRMPTVMVRRPTAAGVSVGAMIGFMVELVRLFSPSHSPKDQPSAFWHLFPVRVVSLRGFWPSHP